MMSAKTKIIKDTIMNSLLSEMAQELEHKQSDKQKRDEILEWCESWLVEILDNMTEADLLPKHDLKSQNEFEYHLNAIIKKVKGELYKKVKDETMK